MLTNLTLQAYSPIQHSDYQCLLFRFFLLFVSFHFVQISQLEGPREYPICFVRQNSNKLQQNWCINATSFYCVNLKLYNRQRIWFQDSFLYIRIRNITCLLVELNVALYSTETFKVISDPLVWLFFIRKVKTRSWFTTQCNSHRFSYIKISWRASSYF